MTTTPPPRIKAPETARPGEIIEIKTLISHRMETGQRHDHDGKLVPRDIINSFTCSFDGVPFVTVRFGTGISANPYLSFFFRATRSGTLVFLWQDDDGSQYGARHELTVV
jgi:sulfur-oxidizing protein SoxZ